MLCLLRLAFAVAQQACGIGGERCAPPRAALQWAASPGMAHQALAITLQKPLLVAELRWGALCCFWQAHPRQAGS